MATFVALVLGVVLGLSLSSLPAMWRRVRRAQVQADQVAAYGDATWFADTTPPPLPSQAQIADAPVISRATLRSVPGRRTVRRTGR